MRGKRPEGHGSCVWVVDGAVEIRVCVCINGAKAVLLDAVLGVVSPKSIQAKDGSSALAEGGGEPRSVGALEGVDVLVEAWVAESGEHNQGSATGVVAPEVGARLFFGREK